MAKTQQELAAITKAFGKKDLPDHPGVKTGGGAFILTKKQRDAFALKKKQAQRRAAAIA